MLCTISARCSIEAQAFSANNNSETRYGYVKLNGVAVWRASWMGEYPVSRGANMFVVDTATCALQDARNFDTYDSSRAAVQLSEYLRALSIGTVLVGVSCDEASRYLMSALPALNALGVDVSDVGDRGAWAFVAEKGDPSKTKLDKERTERAANARQPRITVTLTASVAGAIYTVDKKLCYRKEDSASALASRPTHKSLI